MINGHLELKFDLLTQIRISDYEYIDFSATYKKIDHFCAVSSMISFTSLLLIKRYLIQHKDVLL